MFEFLKDWFVISFIFREDMKKLNKKLHLFCICKNFVTQSLVSKQCKCINIKEINSETNIFSIEYVRQHNDIYIYILN